MESLSSTKSSEPSTNVYILSIGVTIIVLLISVVYSVRNLMKVWRAGNPRKVVPKTEGDDVTAAEGFVKKEEIEEENQFYPEGEVANEIIDPMEYCEHIQSEVKKAKRRATTKMLHNELTPDQLEEESDVKKKQLEAIFKLMESQSEKFGVNSFEDVQHQMKLYG